MGADRECAHGRSSQNIPKEGTCRGGGGHGSPLVVSSDDSAKDLGDDEDMSREMQK